MLLRNCRTGEKIKIEDYITNNNDDDFEIILIEKDRVFFPKPKKFLINNNNNLNHYLTRCKNATRECIKILQSDPYLEAQIDNNNIYCPYHENRLTSKTPSGRFYKSKNSFICFSTKCKKRVSSIDLLQHLQQEKR